MATRSPLEEILELAELMAPAWTSISSSIPAWHPRCETPPASDPPADPPAGDDPPADPPSEPDWKVEARKHEGRAKAERKAREIAERKLAEHATADQTEHEKAIAKARDEAKAEAQTEAQSERRKDHLEVAVTRLAAKTFADSEDALLHVERAIRAGDIDADDIFDTTGKVQTDTLKSELDALLERKPHLKADNPGRPSGSADAGKGSSDALTVEQIKQMTPQQINRRSAEVDEVLAKQSSS